ncbi:D-tyrosyl-tRNA(Tyr) deacylase [Mortierella alpina]|nr:D-tyrosyl-tRNA(Tyr) deacylase [Mortierella alpina]
MPAIKSSASAEAGFKRLVELESAYRTQRPSDQLHAIASYPHLFDEFPDPVIINTVILKLADYFRASVLGCMATIVYDRIDVYHNVIHSLDSSEAMEVSAAVYAADKICAQSQKFCAIISGKLAFMVRDSKTPLPLRRRLIRVFGHMFEDITLARLARKTCLDILDLNQDGEYTVAILRTLTRLASHSLVDVDQQIDLLLQRANGDATTLPGIRRVSLMCLGSLARKSIEFSPDHIKTIFAIAMESQDEKTTLRAMETLNNIFRLTGITTSILLLGDSGLDIMLSYIQMCLLVLERTTASHLSSSTRSRLVFLECFSLLSVLLPSYSELADTPLKMSVTNAEQNFTSAVKSATHSMELFLVRIWNQDSGEPRVKLSQQDINHSKAVLWYWINLSLAEEEQVDKVLRTLLGWIGVYKDVSVLQAKALLHMARQQPRKMHAIEDLAINLLEAHVDAADTQTFMLVYRALLNSAALYRGFAAETKAFESRITSLLEKFGQIDSTERYTRNQWELYQLGRYSLQAGWASLALTALKNQEKAVLSVPHALWLTSMQTVALIESSLQTMAKDFSSTAMEEDVDSNKLDLYSQQQMYVYIMGHLEEIEAYQIDRSFHLRWCSLRQDYLQTCQLAVTTLQLLSTSVYTHRQQEGAMPNGGPSDIALPGDEIALSNCADMFNDLAHQYTLLRANVSCNAITGSTTAYTAPSQSEHQQADAAIEILQTMCLILGFALQRVAKILKMAQRIGAIAVEKDLTLEIDQVFDVDPLLIPLLYHQEQSQGQDAGSGKELAKTFIETFRASAKLALGFVNEHLQGRDLDALEVLQRVVQASVEVNGQQISKIKQGLCVLIGLSVDDTSADLDFMVRKLLSVRVFDSTHNALAAKDSEPSQEPPKMWAKSVVDIGGEILCVSQFTLYGQVVKGSKPDFHLSMKSDTSKRMYHEFLERLKKAYQADRIKDGEFGAMMLVNIANDGPVTLELDSRKFEYIPVTNQSSPAIAKALKQAKTASASTSGRSSVTSLSSDVSSAMKNGDALDEGKASLRLAPSSKSTSAGSASVLDTSNSYGLHDTMRFGMRQIASEVTEKHPLENRLAEWDNTQMELKMNMARNMYGMHAPIKMAMERSLVVKARGPSMLPQRSNLGLDILNGKDETIDFEDFLNVPEMSTDMVDVHTVMEHQLGLRV